MTTQAFRITFTAALAGASAALQATGLEEFLGAQQFSLQQLWTGPGGTSVVVAQDGSVLAFEGTSGNRVVRSADGGASWLAPVVIGADAFDGNAIVDETSGDVLYVNPALNALWRSSDHGASWQKQSIAIAPDAFGSAGLDVRYMQSGITLQYVPRLPYGSDQRGRLIMPARILGPQDSDAPDWRIYHYATAIYSDDGGASWQTSVPFPIMGAADGAIAELTYDGLVFSAREQITRGNRYIGVSPNNGFNWIAADRSADLPDGPRGSPFGLMGGLIRLPVDGYDVLLYSNVDTDSGSMPAEFAGDSTGGREKLTVWASFDGGVTWPLKRLVYEGPSGISSLAAGRAGTASEGKLFLLFEGGPDGSESAVQVAAFNMSWLLDGEDINDYLVELVPPPTVPTVYWTGEGNRYGGQTNGWSTVAYDDPAYPVYGLAGDNGVSSNDTWRFSYDLAGMSGSTSTVRMNRDNVTMVSLTLNAPGTSGFTFTNVDNTGSGHMLAGRVTVLGGIHTFNPPTVGRTMTLMAESTWNIAAGATLVFSHVLAGDRGLNKTGEGALLITGNQLHTGETAVSRGVFGVGSSPASLAGDLSFGLGALLRFSPAHTLSVAGAVTFEDTFGIANLDGLGASAALGTYTLIAGNVDDQYLFNVGILQAASIGGGKWAFFEEGSGLTVTVVDDVPGPVSIWEGFPADNGWKETQAGWIADDSYPFVFRHPAGWFSVYPEGAAVDGFYAYDFPLESWVWSADILNGWRFNFHTETWDTW
jgi:sialidase-1